MRRVLVQITVPDDATDEAVLDALDAVDGQFHDLRVLRDPCVIVKGNPVDGFEFVGPYESRPAAAEDGDIVETDWWVGELESPVIDEEPVKVKHAAPQHAPEWGDD